MELHITRLSMLWKCGEQYRRRYVQGEIIPPGVALIVGSATHKSVELNLLNKLEKKELLPKDTVKDIAAEEVKNRWKEGVKIEEGEKGEGYAIDTAVSLATLHYTDLAPQIEPVAIEKKFDFGIDGIDNYTINGQIDIEEENAIRDTKTAAMLKPTQAEKSLQLTMYGLAAKVQGKEIDKFYLDMLIKSKEPRAVILETTRKQEDYDNLLRRIGNAISQLEAGVFPPCNPDCWWCSQKWCGYYDTCKYVR